VYAGGMNKITSVPANDFATPDRRTDMRSAIRAPCWFSHNAELQTGHIVDISATGARIESLHLPTLGTTLILRHAVGGPMGARVVRHGMSEFAVEFIVSEASVGFMLRVISAHMTNYPIDQDI
jgi:PilZ domain